MLSDQHLLQILSLSTDACAVYDSADLNIRFVNKAMLQIWGKGNDVLGKTFGIALPEVAGQPFEELLRQAWRTGETYRATETPATLLIDGAQITSHFDFIFRPLRNAEGETFALLHTARDVSGQMEAWRLVKERQQREERLSNALSVTNRDVQAANEELSRLNENLVASNTNINHLNLRLQESETDFKRLVEQAPVAILVFRGKDMVIDQVNAAMLEILDKDAGIIGQPLLEGLPEIKGAPAVNQLFEVYRTGKPSDGNEEPVPIKRNGKIETRYFNFSYRPLLDQGRIIGVMDIAVEVTEQVVARKRLEQIIAEKTELEYNLRSNEQRLQSMLDTMAEGLVIVDTDCRPTYANHMAQKIMGISDEGFKERQYNDHKWENQRLDGSPLPIEDHPLCAVLQTGMPLYDQEVAVALPSGEKIFISINAAPLFDEDKQITGGIATFTDVTQRRMVLQQKEDFISVASHELKTPVTTLKASLQLLDRMQDKLSPEMLSKLLGQANRSLNKLSNLINSLLNSNRISQGRFPMHKTTFSIGATINECCQHIRTAGSHDILLKGDLDLKITADEQQIDQVVINLVNNAVKYAPKSRQIIIDVQKQDDMVKISVTDFGMGIPPDKLPHIFKRYYQVGNSGPELSGLGLGLYICEEIVRKHGGEIGADSMVGQGSVFWFTLPLS